MIPVRISGAGRRVFVLATVAAMSLLAGCSVLRSDVEADRIYVLNAPADDATSATAAGAMPGLLVIPRPTLQPGLETDRIALMRQGNELDYFALSRWSGALPQVLGALAVQSMDGAFATVTGVERGAGPAQFELLLTVRHFEAVYAGEGAPEVRVEIECLLVSAAPRRVVGQCDAQARERAAENRMAPIIAAFERAAHAALAEVRSKAVAAAGTAPGAR